LRPEIAALFISALSLAIAALSLGWNIYRDVILKPKLKVRFGVKEIILPSVPEHLTKLILTATNFGPGRITSDLIELKNAPLWRRVLRKTQKAIIIHDRENPMSAQLPATLEVGDNIDLILPYDKDCCLSKPYTHIGLSDSFGRIHWAPTRDMREAKEHYRKAFRTKST
jgi:hypothetical protein